MLHEELDLLRVASRSGIADRPGGFFSNVEFSVGQQLDQWRNNVVLDDSLDLFLVSSTEKCTIRKREEVRNTV